MPVIGAALPVDRQSLMADFDCPSDVSLRDLVYLDLVSSETVKKALSNTTVNHVIGFVAQKISDTRCRVLIAGTLGGFSGLLAGRSVFVGADGSLTQTRPESGYLQRVGVAVSENKILVVTGDSRVKLS